MSSLADMLGLDLEDEETRRAIQLAQNDHEFLRDLVALRRKHDLTQADVARKLGLSQATISAFESYDNDPRLSTVRRYAQAIGALVDHQVVVDPAYAGTWLSIRASVSPSTTVRPARAQVAVDNSNADFALAA